VRERKCERATPPVVGERKFEREREREREKERESEREKEREREREKQAELPLATVVKQLSWRL